MITKEKQRLRKWARDFLRSMGADARAAECVKIRAALESWDCWTGVRTLCAYAALENEPEVLNPWPMGKSILLPRVSGERLTLHAVGGAGMLSRGAFGVLEPGAWCEERPPRADAILVPGLAFDRAGGRLGRGKGFYDRLLEEFEGVRVGVCFDGQVVEVVPCEPHDKRLDFLLTPGGVIACGP